MRGRVIAGRFELERLLGRGGMSEVWLAHDGELSRDVAIKFLGPQADPERFEREARAAGSLSHPNVAMVFDYGEWEGAPYLVLEHLPGGTLEDRFAAGGPLADEDTEQVARDLASGLAYAHAQGLVHRDLKPANVVFDAEGRAKIADFGIARTDGQTTLTEAGTVLGTAAYMSPEQAAGEPVEPASDVYALGTILFRMLTGRLPFDAEGPIELALKHRSEPAPAVESQRPDAPPTLAALTDAALTKDPRARPSAAEIAAALDGETRRIAASTAHTAVLAPERPATSPRRWAARLAVLGVLALAGLALALLAFANDDRTPGAPGPTRERAADTTRTPSRTTDGNGPAPAPAGGSAPTPSTGTDTTAPTDTSAPTATAAEPPPPPPPPPAPSETTGEETGPPETTPAETTPAETSPAVTDPPAPAPTAP